MGKICPYCKFSRRSFLPFTFDGFGVLICEQCHESLTGGKKPRINVPVQKNSVQNFVILKPKIITEKRVVSVDDLYSAVKKIVENEKEVDCE